MSNLEFLRSHETKKTVLGVDKNTGYVCIFSSVNEKFYNAEDKAVKVYVNCPNKDDGDKDFFVGESEFETRFDSFRLQDL